MSIPELVGRHTVLVPMRLEEAQLIAAWVSDPSQAAWWFGRKVGRAEVLQRWPPVFFDDAYPLKGRAFRVDEGHTPVGAAIHGAVEGKPRSVPVELVLAPRVSALVGSDALDALAPYLFDGIHAHRATAELHPGDERGLAAFRGAGYTRTGPSRGRELLERLRPAGPGRGAQAPP